MLYSGRSFSFHHPLSLRDFLNYLQKTSASNLTIIRHMQLDIIIETKWDQSKWNASFRMISHTLKGLKTLHLNIDQKFNETSRPKDRELMKFRDPKSNRNYFLEGLKKLKDLQTDNITIVIGSTGGSVYFECLQKVPAIDCGWTHAQRQIWSRFMRNAIIKKKD